MMVTLPGFGFVISTRGNSCASLYLVFTLRLPAMRRSYGEPLRTCPDNIAYNTLPYNFSRMLLLPQVSVAVTATAIELIKSSATHPSRPRRITASASYYHPACRNGSLQCCVCAEVARTQYRAPIIRDHNVTSTCQKIGTPSDNPGSLPDFAQGSFSGAEAAHTGRRPLPVSEALRAAVVKRFASPEQLNVTPAVVQVRCGRHARVARTRYR